MPERAVGRLTAHATGPHRVRVALTLRTPGAPGRPDHARRPGRTGRAPLRRSLVLLGCTATLLAVVQAVLAARTVTEHQALIAAFPLVGAGFVLVGTVAWSRRPGNPSGSLLCVTGVLILVAALADDGLPTWLTALSLLLGETPVPAVLHVVLAFPAGRLQRRVDRALVVGLWVLVLVRQAPVAAGVALGSDVGLEPLRLACSLVAAVVIVAAAVRLAQRVRGERPGTREFWVRSAVSVYGGGLLLFFSVTARVLKPLLDLTETTLVAVQIVGLAGLPLVFAAGVLRGGFTPTGQLDELASWLGSPGGDDTSLRDALARTVGDPSLTLLHDHPVGHGLVDGDGRPAAAAAGARGRVRVAATDGHDTGVSIDYDRSLLTDPGPVEQAGRVVAVALERERLRTDLLVEREALRASRARVLEVGDQQRRSLAQDLHDLLQSRLTLAALHVGRLASETSDERTAAGLDDLRGRLDTMITEVREMVHGVMPALLLERGLPAAAEDLVDRVRLPTRLEVEGAERLPPAVATHAYFILSEALANVVRHARASTLRVQVAERDDRLHLVVHDDGVGGAVATGAGLRGIADRVEALEGRFSVTSPAGGGTLLEVVIPCGS